MKLSSFRYVGPQACKSMLNNRGMTIASVLTITISLFLCSFFWLLLMNIDANATKVEDDITVVAYLDYSLNLDEEFDQIEQQIRWIGGVADVTFVSREEGLATLEKRFGDVDLISTLGGSNPLPDTFSVTAISADYVPTIAADIEKIDGVDIVRYGEGTVEKLFALTSTLRKVGIAIMLLLAIAAVVLIAMSIRLTIMSRKKEIMIMKWVGATNSFIRWPFFLEGVLLGLMGAVIALTLILSFYTKATDSITSTISFVTTLPLSQVWPSVTLFSLLGGIILGAIGSILPLTRSLDV